MRCRKSESCFQRRIRSLENVCASMLQLQMLQFVQFYVEIDFQDIVIKIFLEAFIYFDEDSASGLTKFFFSFFNAFSAQLRK